MKRIFLAAGLLTLINPAFAQHKNGQEYNKSVFRGFSAKSNREAIKETNKNAMAAFPQWGITVDKANGNIKDIYGPAMNLPGNTLEQKAQSCVHNQLGKLNVKGNEWVLQKNTQNEVGGYVTYHQNIDGHKVVFSKMRFNFTTDGRLKRLQMSNYGTPQNYTSPVLTASEAQTAAQQEMPGAVITSNIVSNDWEWFPVPTENGYDLHPSWAFNIIGTDVNKETMLLRGYVDGITGEVLYRVNDVKFDYDITVKGTVKPNGFASTPTLLPLANLKITVNSFPFYTDALGFYSNNTINVPQNTVFTLAGRWSVVKDVPSNVTAPTQTQNITVLGSTYEYQPTGDIEQRHLTAYYHVNVVHDFMKGKYPTFFDMDVALPTNVDVAGSCNAFYNGSSINFYEAGSGCVSFAEIHDIIYHEYGHGINDKYYDLMSGNSMQNGALNEAYADMWGMSITDSPILGQNSFTSGGFIRRYDLAPKVYPADIVDEVHADGEIIAGAWWDVRENIGDMTITSDIFAKSLNGTPDGPDGTEGEVYHAALISALEADDDNSNINDGTPHFLEIVSAFAEHGIYLLSDAELDHTESINLPDENISNGVNTTLQITYQPFLKDVLMRYRVRPATTWSDVVMTETSPLQFEAQIPGQAAGSIVDYFFVVRDTLQFENAFAPMAYNPLLPALKNNIPYQYGTQLHTNIEENFEGTLSSDWIVGNYTGGIGTFTADAATAGKWIQAVPIPSMANGQPSQAGVDHTSGTGKCLVTGNATAPNAGVGAADVDGGYTTVVTPLFDISGYDEPIVEYYRWYSNNRGSNPGSETWNVRMGTPTSSAWFSVDNTSTSDQSWRRRIFKVKDYLPAATEIRLIFRAEDKTTNGGAAVEAAVDDFMIYSKGWPSSVGTVSAPQKAEIFPNPANEMVNVTLAGNGYAKGTIGIYDVTGKKVTETAIAKSKVSYSLSTSNLAAGTYFLIIQSDKAIQSQKFTVAH